MLVVPSQDGDRPALEAFLDGHNSLRVARRGELVSSLDHPALMAIDGETLLGNVLGNLLGNLLGVATYVVRGEECELLTLHARTRFGGAGTALVTALRDVARDAGCTRLWLVTTNDNVDALRFYQRRGFRLAELRTGAVTRSRDTLKPEIPLTGDHGIELRDELELEMDLRLPEGTVRS